MTEPSKGALWLARALAWTCAALGLSVGAHVVGGGSLPTVGGAVSLLAALLWVGLILTRRRLGAPTLVATLGVSQVLVHTALTVTAAPAGCGSVTGHTGHEVAIACSGSGATVTHTDHSALTMTLAHAAAAIALGVILARSEDAVWFAAGLLWPTLPTTPALPSLARGAVVPTHGDHAPARVPLLGGVGRRGPPVRRAPTVA